MTLKSPHKDWKIDQLAVPDARAVGIEQLITQLWLRIAYDNRPTATTSENYKRVAELAQKIESPLRTPDFVAFDTVHGVAGAWLRADLLKVFKRDRDQFAVARPLHLPATRLRNVAKAGDSGASAIVYTWLKEEAPDLLQALKQWIDVDVDDAESVSHEDLPSYALARLAADEQPDTLKDPGPPLPLPLCRLPGRLYTQDLRSLLAYRGKLPRPVLVEHIGRLTAFHLGLYLLRTYKSVAALERTGELACDDGACLPEGDGQASCPHGPELVVDCGEDARSPAARLAQASWLRQEDVVAKYVRAHLTLKKLQELADGLVARRPLPAGTLQDLAAIRAKAPRGRLDDKARDRISSLLDDAKDDEKRQLIEQRDQYRSLGLADFDAYMALLFQSGERRWFNYLRFLLDSLFLKNESDGLMRQPLGGRRVRRFALSSGMLETLALVALVHQTERGPETRPLRLDQLIDRLADRYGMLVARPPQDLRDDPAAVNAMLDNQRMLRRRLRESGLFVDLSDAFLGQSLKPRVEVRA
jgi:hypothetical protein